VNPVPQPKELPAGIAAGGPGTPGTPEGYAQREGFRILFPSFLEAAASLLRLVVIAAFVLTFILQPFLIPSGSMERTLLVGDFVLVNRQIFAPAGRWRWMLPYQPVQREDVVVFHSPLDRREHLVKRVIGLPGDHLHITDGRVFINGMALNEPYIVLEPGYEDPFRGRFPSFEFSDPGVDTSWWLEMRRSIVNGDLVVPAGHYFVLVDNRNSSRDSRYWGFVRAEEIVARPLMIYFSLRRSGIHGPGLPDGKLGQKPDGPLEDVVSFARWDRMFRVVR
jgi:signal peptidase I